MTRTDRAAPMMVGMLACLAAASASPDVAAAPLRTFVASNGVDSNACSLVAPCRTFAAAIAKTSVGGEVVVEDSAGYGPLTIAKSVSIVAPPGIYAGVTVVGGEGIAINGAGIDVRLKGLAINVEGGNAGVSFQQGASLEIDGCSVTGGGVAGVAISGPGQVSIVDTSVQYALVGVAVTAAAKVAIMRASVVHNRSHGIHVTAGGYASVAQSTVAHNASSGARVDGSVAGVTRLTIDSSQIADNGDRGVLVYDGGQPTLVSADVSRSTITANLNGVELLAIFGTASLTATQNVIADNVNAGIRSTGTGAKARATQNTVVRNDIGLQGNGADNVNSPGNNYVRDNRTNDAVNVTPDTLL